MNTANGEVTNSTPARRAQVEPASRAGQPRKYGEKTLPSLIMKRRS